MAILTKKKGDMILVGQKRSWKRPLLAFAISLSLVLGLSVVACGCSKTATIDKTYQLDLDSGGKRVISMVLNKGDRLDLSVGVAQKDVNVQVIKPSGEDALNITRVESGKFVVIAEEYGGYQVVIDNSYSYYHKSVTLVLKYPKR